jgi:TonB family protein
VLGYLNLMRFSLMVCLAPTLVCAALGQAPADTAAKAPKDPRQLLLAARPAYDFDDASLKPWHLKGKYQLFDENGKPGEEGTYEYWWVAPGVYRSTWSRPSRTCTEWHMADGRTMSVASGKRILAIERELRDLLVSAVPDVSKLKAGDAEIEKDEFKIGKLTLSCAKLRLKPQKDGRTPNIPRVNSGNYCFEEPGLFLEVEYEAGADVTEFHHLRKVQERIIPAEIDRSFSGRYEFRYVLDEMNFIRADDPALKPTTDAKVTADDSPAAFTPGQGRLLNKIPPVYPPAAKSSFTTGSVLLDIAIGKDGRVHDVVVLATSSALLTPAAKDAVLQWQYAPYVVDGEPQEVSSRVKVIFSMGGR